jgi:hypothetical protein
MYSRRSAVRWDANTGKIRKATIIPGDAAPALTQELDKQRHLY